jgi:hypothetical protein
MPRACAISTWRALSRHSVFAVAHACSLLACRRFVTRNASDARDGLGDLAPARLAQWRRFVNAAFAVRISRIQPCPVARGPDGIRGPSRLDRISTHV